MSDRPKTRDWNALAAIQRSNAAGKHDKDKAGKGRMKKGGGKTRQEVKRDLRKGDF